MSRDKQIEEMARALSTVKRCDAFTVSNCIKSKCGYPHYSGVTCIAEHQAEALYNAGYRKASEVAREIITDLEDGIDGLLKVYMEERNKECATDTPIAEYISGKIDAYSSVKFRLAELKKKYTEGEI